MMSILLVLAQAALATALVLGVFSVCGLPITRRRVVCQFVLQVILVSVFNAAHPARLSPRLRSSSAAPAAAIASTPVSPICAVPAAAPSSGSSHGLSEHDVMGLMGKQVEVTIGPLAYRIVMVDDLRDQHDRNQTLHGELDLFAQEIRLNAHHDSRFTRVVLWHEILHAIFEQCGMDQDEAFCDAFGYKLTEILLANPWLAEAPA